jgi:hypothetical protein
VHFGIAGADVQAADQLDLAGEFAQCSEFHW